MLDAPRESSELPVLEAMPREALIAALADKPSQWPYRNDFLGMFLHGGAPEVRRAFQRILDDLAAQGAEFQGLSGTGSTCFGIFCDEGAAEQAVQALEDHWKFIHLTFFLARSGTWVLQ